MSRVSLGRILSDAFIEREDTLWRATIPVVALNTGPESEDSTLRSYAKDWVTVQSVEPVRASCTFERLPVPRVWKYDNGLTEERPVVAVIVLSWWPKPRESEQWNTRKPQPPKDEET